MSFSEVFGLCLFAALCGGAFGNLYRATLKVPRWLFED